MPSLRGAKRRGNLLLENPLSQTRLPRSLRSLAMTLEPMLDAEYVTELMNQGTKLRRSQPRPQRGDGLKPRVREPNPGMQWAYGKSP